MHLCVHVSSCHGRCRAPGCFVVFFVFFFLFFWLIFLMMAWVGVGWGGMLTFMWRSWCYVDHGVAWGGVGWDVNVHVTLMMLRWSMLMVLVHGPKLRKFWKFLVFKWIISIKNMLPQFVRCPKDCPRSVEHRPLIQIGNRWSAGFPRKLPKKRHWWLGDPLLKIGAKGLAMDVAQNNSAQQ